MAPIYERSTRELLADAASDLRAPFQPKDVVAWFTERYPKLKPGTVRAHINFMTANDRNRRHHAYLGGQQPVLFRTDGGLVPYDATIHGTYDEQGESLDAPSSALLEGFSPAVPVTADAVATSHVGAGVHVVFDDEDQLVYVGRSNATRSRLAEHLSGDRSTSLQRNLGEELDQSFGEVATKQDIQEHLSAWSISWKETEAEAAQPLKDAIMREFKPRLNKRTPPSRGVWWVNQGNSYEMEREAGLVFAKVPGEGEQFPVHHQNLERLRPGDLVLHYQQKHLRAVGTVTATASQMTRPYGPLETRDYGNAVPVRYEVLDRPIGVEEIHGKTAADGPFDKHGNVKQQYLIQLSPEFVNRITRAFADRWPPNTLTPFGGPDVMLEDLSLDQLVEHFRSETDYPTPRDEKKHAERVSLAASLSPEGLAELGQEPTTARMFFNRVASSAYGSPGNQSTFNKSIQADEMLDRVLDNASHLLHGPGDVADRIDAVLDESGRKVPGFREALVTKLLCVLHPERWIPRYIAEGPRGKLAVIAALGLPAPPDTLTTGQRSVATNDLLHELLLSHFGEDAWGIECFVWWRLQQAAKDTTTVAATNALGPVAARLFVPEEFLAKAIRLLDDRRQIVFYGPPGTGKTYIARELAAHVAGTGEVMKVQFHPSYAYEDFVEGYRPRLIDGRSTFELVDGPLKELARAAEERPEVKHVLLIDELNRGNVAKILGELFFLLEYRDEEMRLQYSAQPFTLPENLLIIATMNTADRSIALVDAALRRRFYFVPFFPDEMPVKGLLHRWLHANRPDMEWVAELVDEANSMLDSRHLAIGPSHFLRKDLSEDWLALIWEHSVMPYLAEQFFGDEDRLTPFSLDRLRAKAAGPSVPDLDEDDAESDDGALG